MGAVGISQLLWECYYYRIEIRSENIAAFLFGYFHPISLAFANICIYYRDWIWAIFQLCIQIHKQESCKCGGEKHLCKNRQNISCSQRNVIYKMSKEELRRWEVKQRGQAEMLTLSEWPRCQLVPCGVVCPSSLTQGIQSVCCSPERERQSAAMYGSLSNRQSNCSAHTQTCSAPQKSYHTIFHSLTVDQWFLLWVVHIFD